MWQTHGSSCEFLCKVTFPGDVQIKHAPRKKKKKNPAAQSMAWTREQNQKDIRGRSNNFSSGRQTSATLFESDAAQSPGGGGVKAGGPPKCQTS